MPDHVYRVRVLGDGRPRVMWSEDAQGSSHDNGGEHVVRVLEVVAPTPA